MLEALEVLEQRRQQLYQQLQAVGDFRPGMISANFRKCGKPSCGCAEPGQRGHGPQYLWNTSFGGKSQAQNVRLGPELEKVERELENYQRFQQLCAELVAVNLKICQRRPAREVADAKSLEQLKKKLRKKYNKR